MRSDEAHGPARSEEQAGLWERRWAEVLECAPEAIVLVDSSGRSVMANRLAGEIFGAGFEPGRRWPFRGALTDHEASKIRRCGRDLRCGQFFDLNLERRGQALAARVGRTTFDDWIAVVRDETHGMMRCGEFEALLALRAAALAESREQMQSILDTAGDAIVSIDGVGRIDVFNRAAERLFGYTRSEAIGAYVSLLMPSGEAKRQDEYISRYLKPGSRGVLGRVTEVLARRRDGTIFPVELRIGAYDGGRFCGFVRDITERKEQNQQFVQAQKMEVVGRLAAGVAHDFNNLLAGILSGIRIVLDRLGSRQDVRPLLVDLVEEIGRGRSVAGRLLDFSRPSSGREGVSDLSECVPRAAEVLRRILGEDIAVKVIAPSEPLPVDASHSMIEQVLMNLAINARDAMPLGGSLRIECRRIGSSGEKRCSVAAFESAELAVIDDGIGMDADTVRRASEPFFTTKPLGKGTGLGLSTVRSLVQSLGGNLSIYSEEGRGTAVRISLPLALAGNPEVEQRLLEESEEPVVGTVLVVEDERLVRMGLQHILEQAGYTVVAVADVAEALREMRRRSRPIDLLVTDVVLPGEGGPELVAEARRIVPGLPYLYVSAHSKKHLVARGRIHADDDLVEKPFDVEDVLAAARVAMSR
jgi:PAS domain S-box-containing protein